MTKAIYELELESTAEITTGHRTALLAGFLGWMLDAFDFFLVVFCLTAIAREFHQTDRAIALSITLTLAFRPVGAFIFGALADK
jgi:SHS family lactate transporter-like MFS transporter